MPPIQEVQIDARFYTCTTVQRPDAYEARVVAVSEEGGQDKRRQRICRVKSLSARWFAQRGVERRLRWSMNYAVDHTPLIVRFTRVSTPNLDEVAR